MIKLHDLPSLRSGGAIKEGTQPLIVIDRRPVTGTGVCSWMGTLGPEFDPILMATIDGALGQDVLGRARAAIWNTNALIPGQDEWLCNEIDCARTRRRDLPLVLLADAADPQLAEEAVRQLDLSGYIPTSSSLELAATALRLVIAGGRYVPGGCFDVGTTTLMASQGPPVSSHDAKLTARERAVLGLLEHGLPNKIIAHRLGMSQSTVKAHVHNIIAKLNVRNRTEAATARYMTLDRRTPQ